MASGRLRPDWSLDIDLLDHATQNTFAQFRTRRRAVELAFGAICALGRQHQDWSADYKLFSRSPWDPNRLFHPVLETYVDRYPDRPLVVGLDDTKTRKTGRHIQPAFWQRDPLSPAFHTNLIYGLRFLQIAALFPHYEEKDTLGVGQAQVWSAHSVPRQPALVVAAYALLLVASIQAFGPGRTDHFVPLQKWRRNAKRPSVVDLITLLRKEINETGGWDALTSQLIQDLILSAQT